MSQPHDEVVTLENKFWQSMVDQDTDTALAMLSEPALMVSPHGAMQFDHAGYRRMAEQGSMVLKDYRLSDMRVLSPNDGTAILTYTVEQSLSPRGESDGGVTQKMTDTSVWVRSQGQWQCAMHTETPVGTDQRP